MFGDGNGNGKKGRDGWMGYWGEIGGRGKEKEMLDI